MTMPEGIGFLIAGALGAFAKDCVKDGKIKLPYKEDGSLVLGFIGGMIVGAFVGYAVDQTFVTSALGGYAGVSAIEHLLPIVDKPEKEAEQLKKE